MSLRMHLRLKHHGVTTASGYDKQDAQAEIF